MKEVIKTVILTCVLFVFTGVFHPVKAQADGNSYVTVKLYEPINKKGEIIVSYGGSKSERIAIDELNSTHQESNCNKLTDVFNRLATEGYSMVSSAGSSHGNSASILHVETFIFKKVE